MLRGSFLYVEASKACVVNNIPTAGDDGDVQPERARRLAGQVAFLGRPSLAKAGNGHGTDGRSV
jgi:hypothetical protein